MTTYSKPLLLDGSMGQEIVNRGGKSDYGEWSVAALYENPKLVKEIHHDYIQAGADVITTNTYSTSRTRLRHTGMEDRLAELVNIAGSLALSAKKDSGKDQLQIAGSFAPLEASYISEFQLSFDEMVAEFRELMDLLDPYIDLYLGETFSTTLESKAFLSASAGRNKPVWVSWTLHNHGDNHLRGEETLSEAVDSLKVFAPDAVLINCCKPESIDKMIPKLQASGLAYGGYANGFTEVPDSWEGEDNTIKIMSRKDLSPQVYATHALNWVKEGASIVGGCCDVGPAHIAHLRNKLDALK